MAAFLKLTFQLFVYKDEILRNFFISLCEELGT